MEILTKPKCNISACLHNLQNKKYTCFAPVLYGLDTHFVVQFLPPLYKILNMPEV